MLREQLRRIALKKALAECSSLIEYWNLREMSLHGLLVGSGVSIEDALAPPEKKDELAAGYCPLCLTEYRPGCTSFADCGLDLKRFA